MAKEAKADDQAAAEPVEAPREKTLHELNVEAAKHAAERNEYIRETVAQVVAVLAKREGNEVAQHVADYLPDLIRGKRVQQPRIKAVRGLLA